MSFIKSVIKVKCCKCQEDLVIGLNQSAPHPEYVLSPTDIEGKKQQLLRAIQSCSLNEEQKKAALDMYGAKDVILDPDMADALIQEITSKYANPMSKTEALSQPR